MPKKATTTKAKAAPKPAAKTASKAIKKDTPKSTKSAPAAKAKAAATKKAAPAAKGSKTKYLDLGLLLDITSSMWSWVTRAKDTLSAIIDNVKASSDGLTVRVCFVGYRDHCDSVRFDIMDFTENIDDMKAFIQKVTASGGGDAPEDVTGGMRKVLDQSWSTVSVKQVFHIFDAPCHGSQYHDFGNFGDNHPKGCPEGLILEDLLKEFKSKSIGFTAIKLTDCCNKMCDAFKKAYPELTVTDMDKAAAGKSAAEVNKIFAESASYILRAAVGGSATGKGKSAAAKRAASSSKPLWDAKQLAVNQHFSCISYLHVDAIDGDKVTVKNQLGGAWFISKDLLERDCWSGDHFDKEVKCTMTQLTAVLDSCRDTIFKVSFKKKLD